MVGRLRAVVLDLDGTLVDSLPDIADALNAGLACERLPPFDLARVRGMVGGGVRVLVERAFAAMGPQYADPELFKRVVVAALAHYRAHPCDKTRLFPLAREALDALVGEGVKLGLCTNKHLDLTEAILAELDIRALFGSVVGSNGTLPLKPDPAMLQACLAELGVAPSEAVMVGDSSADLGAARAAGCPVILVSFGYTQTPAAELGGDLVIDSFAELPGALGRIAAR